MGHGAMVLGDQNVGQQNETFFLGATYSHSVIIYRTSIASRDKNRLFLTELFEKSSVFGPQRCTPIYVAGRGSGGPDPYPQTPQG